jgi:hypothetical protein
VHDLRQEPHRVARYFNVRDFFNELSKKIFSVTHRVLVGLSEFGSISIDNGMGARGKRRVEDTFPSKDSVNILSLRIRLVSGCLSLDMIVRKESRSTFAIPTVIRRQSLVKFSCSLQVHESNSVGIFITASQICHLQW